MRASERESWLNRPSILFSGQINWIADPRDTHNANPKKRPIWDSEPSFSQLAGNVQAPIVTDVHTAVLGAV
jgi:hypothetical protein